MENFYHVITIVIAVCAIVSPVLVALINNAHNRKMRKLELKHEFAVKQLDVYYKEKKEAFKSLVNSVGYLVSSPCELEQLEKLHSTAADALLFCSEENKQKIEDFLLFASSCKRHADEFTAEEMALCTKKISELSQSLNNELKSTTFNP